MASFSHDQDPAFFLDSCLGPTHLNSMSCFSEEGTINTCFSETVLPNNHEYLQDIPLHPQTHETSPLYENCSAEFPLSSIADSSLSTVTKHDSNSSAMVVDKLLSPAYQVTQAEIPSPEHFKRKNMERMTGKRRTKHVLKKQKIVPEEASSDYVLVRARRGEATDSHSLAERERRAQIRARMMRLQSLVPGCDKMIGQTVILDQIITYVQTLQTQVEFLAAKLASENPICTNDVKVDFDSNTLAQETCSLDFELPPVLESSSAQLTSFAAESSKLIGTNFVLPDQKQRANTTFQDINGHKYLWDTDGSRRHDHVSYFGSANFGSF